MKKFWSFVKSNVNIAIVILGLVILSLIITYWDVEWMNLINDKIIPLAYLVSVIFIYKAFRESKKSNVIAIGKVLYEKYSSEITSLSNWLNKIETIGHIFTNKQERIKLNSSEVHGMKKKVEKIVQFLRDIPEFKQYHQRIADNDETILRNYEMAFTVLVNDYTGLYRVLSDYQGHMMKYWSIYQSIYENRHSMAQEHINLLIEELMIYFRDYKLICEQIIKNEFPYDQKIVVVNMHDFSQPKKPNDEILLFEFSTIYNDNFLWVYENIKETENELLKYSH